MNKTILPPVIWGVATSFLCRSSFPCRRHIAAAKSPARNVWINWKLILSGSNNLQAVGLKLRDLGGILNKTWRVSWGPRGPWGAHYAIDEEFIRLLLFRVIAYLFRGLEENVQIFLCRTIRCTRGVFLRGSCSNLLTFIF